MFDPPRSSAPGSRFLTKESDERAGELQRHIELAGHGGSPRNRTWRASQRRSYNPRPHLADATHQELPALVKMVPWGGFEPPTSPFVAVRSIQLSYQGIKLQCSFRWWRHPAVHREMHGRDIYQGRKLCRSFIWSSGRQHLVRGVSQRYRKTIRVAPTSFLRKSLGETSYQGLDPMTHT